MLMQRKNLDENGAFKISRLLTSSELYLDLQASVHILIVQSDNIPTTTIVCPKWYVCLPCCMCFTYQIQNIQ